MIADLMISFVISRKLISISAVSPVLTLRPFTATIAPSASMSANSGVIVILEPPCVAPIIEFSKFHLWELSS